MRVRVLFILAIIRRAAWAALIPRDAAATTTSLVERTSHRGRVLPRVPEDNLRLSRRQDPSTGGELAPVQTSLGDDQLSKASSGSTVQSILPTTDTNDLGKSEQGASSLTPSSPQILSTSASTSRTTSPTSKPTNVYLVGAPQQGDQIPTACAQDCADSIAHMIGCNHDPKSCVNLCDYIVYTQIVKCFNCLVSNDAPGIRASSLKSVLKNVNGVCEANEKAVLSTGMVSASPTVGGAQTLTSFNLAIASTAMPWTMPRVQLTTAQGMNGLAAPKTGSAVRQSASIGGMTMVMLSAAWFCLCS